MRDGCPLSLLVRNLRYTTSPDRVRRFFEQFGDVRDVYLPLDYYTKLPRGFGFVEFTRDEDAENALQALSRHATLDGAEISVTVAQQGRKSPDSMRRRERVNHQGGQHSHHRYDDGYDSRRRRGRGDSSGGHYTRRYRSRSRSIEDDGRRHSNSHRRYHGDPRWSSSDRHGGAYRDKGENRRHTSRREPSPCSQERIYNGTRQGDDRRGDERARDDRCPSHRGTRLRRSSSRSSGSRRRYSSVDHHQSGDAVSPEQHMDRHASRNYPEPESANVSHDYLHPRSDPRPDDHAQSRSPSESPDRRVHEGGHDIDEPYVRERSRSSTSDKPQLLDE